ncbi:reticulon-like protein B1 [Zingiber officinale]|uniref:reticulon-like protein B1 n=1 Tax=Zingiber officinale TaxID=94328 RepID=UPI001C4D7EBF|nr:reticulon-like protein B1 [Zingiber officinale]
MAGVIEYVMRGGGTTARGTSSVRRKLAAPVRRRLLPEKAKVFRLFGREKSVHHVLGGGQAFHFTANLIQWRDKKISAGILVGAIAIWILFEFVGYHLLPLIFHGLIISLLTLFLWSKALTLINKSPPHIPEVRILEDQTVTL